MTAGNFGNYITLVAHDGLTLPNAAAVTEIGGAAGRFRTRVNPQSDNHMCRLVVGVSVNGAGTEELVAQYSEDGTNWTDFATAPLTGVAGNASAGPWVIFPQFNDAFVRLVTRNGNGATSPVVGNIQLQLRT